LAKSERGKKSKSRRVEHKGKSKSIAPIRKKDVASILLGKVSENLEALRYIALFLAFCLTFYLVYYPLTLRGSLSILNNNTALILGMIFSLGGANVIRNGQFSSIVYCSAVLAYPTTAKNKCLGMVFGIPLLYVINIFRLALLVLVGIYYPVMFEFVHVYLWQASFIIFVVVLFVLWLKLVVQG
jgi:exosortase/archaeosortase family protein